MSALEQREAVDPSTALSSGIVNQSKSRELVALLAAMSVAGPLSIDMYLPESPSLSKELHSGADAAQATVSIFLAGLAAGQLVYGPASDRLGRRAPVLFGLGLFVLASMVCAVAPSMHLLLAARLVQGLGACASMVIARAIVRDHFDHHHSARFLSLLALVSGLAPILGPSLGSFVLNLVGWRAIFVVLAVFGAVLSLAVLLRLRESRSEAARLRAHDEHPFRSYLGLLREKRLLGYLLAGALNGACMFTYIATSSGVFIGHYQISPTQFGLLFGFNAVGVVIGSQLNRRLLRRHSPDEVLARTILVSVGFALMLTLATVTGFGGLWGIAIPLFLTISSMSIIQANSMAGAFSVDPLRAGSTSALFGACSFGTGALAATIAGLLNDGTARPMAWVITACLIGCTASVYCIAERKSEPSSGA